MVAISLVKYVGHKHGVMDQTCWCGERFLSGCKYIFRGRCMSLLQIGDAADAKAQAAEARQEELITKEFASKARVEEHRSESHEESKNGEVTKKTSKSSDKKSETHSQAAEGAGVGEHE